MALVAGDNAEEVTAPGPPLPVALTWGRLSGHRGGDERHPVCQALSEASTGRVCRTRSPAPACWSVSKEAARLSPDWGWDTAGPPEKNLHQPCLQGAPCTTECVRSLQLSADDRDAGWGLTVLEVGDRDPRVPAGRASPEASLLGLQTAKLLPVSSRLPPCLRPSFHFSEGQQSHWN